MTDYERWHRDGLKNGYFKRALDEMQPTHMLFKLVKAAIKHRGNWKKKPNGKPFEKGHDPRRPTLRKQ